MATRGYPWLPMANEAPWLNIQGISYTKIYPWLSVANMAPWLNIQGVSHTKMYFIAPWQPDYQGWLCSSMAPWLNKQELPTTDFPCTPWLPVAVWLPVAKIPKNKSTKPP